MCASRRRRAQQGDCAGGDGRADLGQVLVHSLDIDLWHDQGGPCPAGWADGAEQISPGEPAVALDAGARAAFGPDAGQRALLTDAGFVLEPDFDWSTGEDFWDRSACAVGEVFLKLSCASRSVFGWIGRADMLLKLSFLSTLPTVRSCI